MRGKISRQLKPCFHKEDLSLRHHEHWSEIYHVCVREMNKFFLSRFWQQLNEKEEISKLQGDSYNVNVQTVNSFFLFFLLFLIKIKTWKWKCEKNKEKQDLSERVEWTRAEFPPSWWKMQLKYLLASCIYIWFLFFSFFSKTDS